MVSLSNLTPAEAAIVAVLRDNPIATNAEIAGLLGKSERTIENQLRRLYKRLGLDKQDYNKRRLLLVAQILNQR